jgi:hypothetical protein
MKIRTLIALMGLYFVSACASSQQLPEELKTMMFLPEDKMILATLLEKHAGEGDQPMQELMLSVGSDLLGNPYVAHTLEREDERLVVNLREFDCTTFAESCLAIARTIRSGDHRFERFATELLGIRYREGRIDGYPSRIHYFSDWILTNQQKGLVRDVSEENGGLPFPLRVDFMSTHPESYRQLKADPSLTAIIAGQEQEISARKMFYIPTSRLAAHEAGLRDGDIVGITTNIGGLDIAHVGILVRRSGRIHLMHASSKAGEIVISEVPLEAYLNGRRTFTGIMVARPI